MARSCLTSSLGGLCLLAILLPAGAGAGLSAPVELTARAGPNWVMLCWKQDTLNIGDEVTQYIVYRTTGVPAGYAQRITSSDTGKVARGFWDTGLAPDISYGYFVQAVGNTTYADSTTVWIATGETPSPFGTVYAQSNDASVLLSWKMSPFFPGVDPVTGFRIFRATHSGSFSGPPIGTADTGGFYLDTAVDNLALYYYSVFPCCPDRCPSYLFAIPFRQTRGQGVPVVVPDPSGPRVLKITWQAAISPSGSYPVVGYNVYRSNDGGGSMELVAFEDCQVSCDLTVIDEVPAYGKRYVYLVRPVDSHGNVGDAYPLAYYDVVLPSNRLFLDHNSFRPDLAQFLSVYFQITEKGRVRISIFTATGELVKQLYDTEHHEWSFTPDLPFHSKHQGLPAITWDGSNTSGQRVASGIYVLVLEVNAERSVHTVAVIR